MVTWQMRYETPHLFLPRDDDLRGGGSILAPLKYVIKLYSAVSSAGVLPHHWASVYYFYFLLL